MAYDEGLAQRIKEYFEERDDVVEKKMFGGVAGYEDDDDLESWIEQGVSFALTLPAK